MQIQVNTDNHIKGSAEFISQVASVVEDGLRRFADRITTVEVRLTDENSSAKTGDADIRCVMEARLGGLPPIIVSDQSSVLMQALDAATDKMERTIERTLGKLNDRHGRTSMSGD